jgi:hypothetical protein
MSAFVDALYLAVAGSGAVTVLASSLRAFFSQPRRSQLKITIRGEDQEVTIDANNVRDVARLLETLLAEDKAEEEAGE